MLRRVSIRNFQSLAQVDLDLGPLTVIIGASNSGKTAVVRALEAALFNRSGGAFVRSGSDETVVQVTFDEGEMTWEKPRRGGGRYVVAGQTITRVGRDIPPEMEQLTGVREIVAEGLKARPQFDDQFDEPFLLAGTGGQAARLLARVSKLDVLVTAQVLARRDMERMRRAAAESQDHADRLRERLAAQPDYEALLERWRDLSARAEELAVAQERVRRGEALNAEWLQLSARVLLWREKRLPARAATVAAESERLAERLRAVTALGAAEAEVARQATALTEGRAKLEAAEGELHDLLAGLDVCPLCGRAMP